MTPRWQRGDRVTRLKCFEDGSWEKRGDAAILKAKRLHGTVQSGRGREVLVRFDDGTARYLLPEGLERE